MKKLIIILAMAFGAASCNFLDVIPEGKPTIDRACGMALPDRANRS